jgi:acylphosphatase
MGAPGSTSNACGCTAGKVNHAEGAAPLSNELSSVDGRPSSAPNARYEGGADVKAVRAVVRGRVQGVGYRQATRVAARALGLHGWVRNTREGTVELFAQGEDDAVNRLVDWLWLGPTGDGVSGVESDVVPLDPQLHDFFIRQ